MTTKEKYVSKGNRIYWLDNLRTITILFVVLYHVGGVYEAAGMWGWFWIVDDPATITWVGIVGILFDVFIMGTLFFLVITPVGLVLRLLARDPMERRMLPEAESYWVEARGERPSESYFKQF